MKKFLHAIALRVNRRDHGGGSVSPELSFQEQRTSDVIARALTGWGIPIHRGLAKTGLVAVLKKAGGGQRAGGS